KEWSVTSNLVSTLESLRRPDVTVVSGSYGMPVAHFLKRWLRRNRVPWYYWGENPWKKDHSWAFTALKRSYLRAFLAPAVGVLGVGSEACAAYRALLPKATVHNLPYAPDLRSFTRPEPEAKSVADRMRSEWEEPSAFVIMFSGSLTLRKAPDLLLDAFQECSPEFPRLRLLFVGDGPMRAALERKVKQLRLVHRVRF